MREEKPEWGVDLSKMIFHECDLRRIAGNCAGLDEGD